MNLQMKMYGIKDFLKNNVFWIIIIGYIISLFRQDFSILIYIAGILTICLSTELLSERIKLDIVSTYLIYMIMSLLMYQYNDRPVALYFKGIAYVMIPMFLYFIPKKNMNYFMEKTFSAIFFSFIIALILYIWAPEFYSQYLYSKGFIGGPRAEWIRPSLIQGLYGITTIGSLSACSVIYYYWQMAEQKKYSGIKCLICLCIMLSTKRRAAVISALMVFVLENIILNKMRKKVKQRMFILMAISVLGLLLCILFKEQVWAQIDRLINVKDAFGERSGVWTEMVTSMGMNMVLGYGLGSSGHAAIASGYMGVPDGQYVFTFVELGIIGIILFICIIIKSFRTFINNKEKNYVPMFFVLLLLLQSLGSNILEFPILAILFWYSLSAMQGTRQGGKYLIIEKSNYML